MKAAPFFFLILLSGCCTSTWFHRCAPPIARGPEICYETGTIAEIAARHGLAEGEAWRVLVACPAWTASLCPAGVAGEECRKASEKGINHG